MAAESSHPTSSVAIARGGHIPKSARFDAHEGRAESKQQLDTDRGYACLRPSARGASIPQAPRFRQQSCTSNSASGHVRRLGSQPHQPSTASTVYSDRTKRLQARLDPAVFADLQAMRDQAAASSGASAKPLLSHASTAPSNTTGSQPKHEHRQSSNTRTRGPSADLRRGGPSRQAVQPLPGRAASYAGIQA